MCLAKGLGGGFPMGAFAYTKAIRDVLTPGAHGSTFGGSPLACAAGLAAIEAYRDEDLIKRSAVLGARHAQPVARRARRRRDGSRHSRARLDDRRRAAHQGGAGAQEPDAQSRRDCAAGRTHGAAPAAAARDHREGDQSSACRRLPRRSRSYRPDGLSAGGASSWSAAWSRSRRCRDTKRRHRRGSSSRCAPPATIARSSTRPATPWASLAIRPRRARSCCSATSTPFPATSPFASRPRADGKSLLFGRGSVDAKGPLATFAAGAARFGRRRPRPPASASSWSARSKKRPPPARARASSPRRFDGKTEPIPTACIIGEPSHWNRVTLGYKGRLLLDFTADQPMAHTAGPDASVASVVVDYWNWVTAHAARDQRRQGQGLRSAESEPAPLHHLDQRADARHGRCAVRLAAAGWL